VAKNQGRNRIVFRTDNLLNCWGGSATAVE
jgi:hypothetical protein